MESHDLLPQIENYNVLLIRIIFFFFSIDLHIGLVNISPTDVSVITLCIPWKKIHCRSTVKIILKDSTKTALLSFFSFLFSNDGRGAVVQDGARLRHQSATCVHFSKKKKRVLTLSMTVCAYVFPRAFSNIGCKRTNSAPCTKPHTQRLTPSAPRWSVSVYNAEVSQLSLVKL